MQEPTDASRVIVHGPGVEDGVKSQQPTRFFVDCLQAGPGTVNKKSYCINSDASPF